MVKKATKELLMFAGAIALLHHFIGHMLIQGYLINTLGWGLDFFNSLPGVFLGSTLAVTLYIFAIVWFFGKRFKIGKKLFSMK